MFSILGSGLMKRLVDALERSEASVTRAEFNELVRVTSDNTAAITELARALGRCQSCQAYEAPSKTAQTTRFIKALPAQNGDDDLPD